MAEYGVTPTCFNPKTLDAIMDDLHAGLSEAWGVNTRQSPSTLINHLLTNYADALAELWELAGAVYHAHYVASAEGLSLDNAVQYAGVSRNAAAKSLYYILCTGADGTEIPIGTTIASSTNPPTELTNTTVGTITRAKFNTASIRITNFDNNALRVAINSNVYSYMPEEGETRETAIAGLAAQITDPDFVVTADTENLLVSIYALDETSTNVLTLSSNLTTETVGSIVLFATNETGDIYLPSGVINRIVKSVPGLNSVENVGSYIAGNDDETDIQLRESYGEKIYNISDTMIDSIRSAILLNVQGVKAVSGYENVGDTVDEYGRYPHSVEIIVDGGDSAEIARWILRKKSGGINTYGSIEVPTMTSNGDEITIRFNRPMLKKIWIKVVYTITDQDVFPTDDYVDLTKQIILEKIEALDAGDSLIPQRLFSTDLFNAIDGISLIDITMADTEETPQSEDYTLRIIPASARERITTEATMISVSYEIVE